MGKENVNQLSMFADTARPPRKPPKARARRSDAISSQNAAEDMNKTGLARAQRRHVFDMVCLYPGRTTNELAKDSDPFPGSSRDQYRFILGRRMSELVESGLVARREGVDRFTGKSAQKCWPVAGAVYPE